MSRVQNITISHASLDRKASITLHETITAPPKRKKKPTVKLAPGSYAAAKPEGAALPRTTYRFDELEPLPQPYVRDGGNDFLKLPSKGFSC